MTRPVVALHADAPVPAGLQLLVRSMTPRCRVRSHATSPAAALVVGSSGAAEGVPFALWCSRAEDAQSPLADRAVALLHDGALDELGHPAALRVSPPTAGLSSTPVGTAVRARLRRARGMSAQPVFAESSTGWSWAGHPVPAPLVPTAMACAAVVVATEPSTVLRALSWGAPVVTSAETAAALGATPGVDVQVAADEVARHLAARLLAGDERAAARLGRSGRLLIERRYDLDRTVTRLALLLHLDGQDQPLRLPGTLLDGLSTPADAAIRRRVALAFAAFSPPRPEATMLPDALSPDHTAALEPTAAAPAGPKPAVTAKRVARAVLRRAVGAGAAPLVEELRANRADLARLQAEVVELRAAAAGLTSPDALAADLELLRAEVAGLAVAVLRQEQER